MLECFDMVLIQVNVVENKVLPAFAVVIMLISNGVLGLEFCCCSVIDTLRELFCYSSQCTS